MKVIIAGSRELDECTEIFEFIKYATEGFITITEVVCGMASGVDTCGMYYAMDNHIPVKYFPADWKKHGKSAGPIRNQAMADYADAAIFIINNESKGSMHCLSRTKANQKPHITFHLTDGILDYVEQSEFGNRTDIIDGRDYRVIELRSRIAAAKTSQI